MGMMSGTVLGNFVSATIGAGVIALALATSAAAGGDWNDAAIAWRPYEEGLADAKTGKKPVCLVFYTDWCPHCTNYARVFHDPGIVEKSKAFVMIRLNKDQNGPISAKYAPDGEYIPRTFFLGSDGTLKADITEQRPSYKYFYNEQDPASLLRAMNEATGAGAAAPPVK
jgi:thiol:disulfide interchange protein